MYLELKCIFHYDTYNIVLVIYNLHFRYLTSNLLLILKILYLRNFGFPIVSLGFFIIFVQQNSHLTFVLKLLVVQNEYSTYR